MKPEKTSDGKWAVTLETEGGRHIHVFNTMHEAREFLVGLGLCALCGEPVSQRCACERAAAGALT